MSYFGANSFSFLCPSSQTPQPESCSSVRAALSPLIPTPLKQKLRPKSVSWSIYYEVKPLICPYGRRHGHLTSAGTLV